MEKTARQIIAERLREKGQTMAWLSRALGRNHAYVQQYITTHTPQDLEFQDKVKVSKLLGIPLTELGVDIGGHARATGQHPAGLSEEAESYVPPAGSHLSRASEDVAYFVARSSALDRHPLQIRSGDIVAASIAADALDKLASGDVVVVQLYDKADGMTATTVLRQYVAPGLLITNSSEANTIWRIDDASLPFEPVIKARVVSVIRTVS